jgi:ribonuclease HI
MPKKKFNDAKSILDMGPHRHIVFTDGSCNPNNKSIKSRAGYAACFVSGPCTDIAIYGNLDMSSFYASNIRAEGMAIIRALEYIYEQTKNQDSLKEKWLKITVITDCEFWINMVEKYMPNWDKDKFKEKSNPDMTKRLWLIYKTLDRLGGVKFMHVKSHNKEGWRDYADGTFEKYCYEQNDYADQLCGFARISMKPCEEVIKDVVYDDESDNKSDNDDK